MSLAPDRHRSRPSVAQAMLRRELLPWTLLGLTLGLVEGATAAVLLKQRFGTAAHPFAVNIAVAMVSGAPALSNVISFVWANVAHGRARIQLTAALQAAFAVAVGFVGLAPAAIGGLLFSVVSIVAARLIWAGIITIRASIWIANYPREVLARVTGRILIANSVTVALAAAGTAIVIQSGRADPRWLYAAAALAGLLAAWRYRSMRVRREFQLLYAENASVGRSAAFSPRLLLSILREDPEYRRYMLWMGVYGAGNLMLTSQMVVIMTEQLHVPSGAQIAMLAVVPLLILPFFVPMWARMFDRGHVVEYRARQAWVVVAAIAVLCAGTLLAWNAALWGGAALLGVGLAGANLGWNLGHNDFAEPGRAQLYMGVHVTLTGLRGVIAPPLGIAVYQALEAAAPGSGRWSMLLPLAGTTAGALGFTMMSRGRTGTPNP
jgi:hypothetical protein